MALPNSEGESVVTWTEDVLGDNVVGDSGKCDTLSLLLSLDCLLQLGATPVWWLNTYSPFGSLYKAIIWRRKRA